MVPVAALQFHDLCDVVVELVHNLGCQAGGEVHQVTGKVCHFLELRLSRLFTITHWPFEGVHYLLHQPPLRLYRVHVW